MIQLHPIISAQHALALAADNFALELRALTPKQGVDEALSTEDTGLAPTSQPVPHPLTVHCSPGNRGEHVAIVAERN
jgi:hypothetical protein